MRPKRLVLEGFASFRDREEVTFEDVDLFVLAGPTGAGKSSILDAMGFALYGCVSRYDDGRLVGPVICQGSNQARVQLDFSIGGKDYTAVRVVRRTPSGGGTTAEARLECGDETLAGSAAELTDHIAQRVIGLDFEQFTKCVMLPQGDFAQFLHAKGKERQDLLVRLLDVESFRRIRTAAGERQKDAEKTAGERRARLANDLAGATPEALAGADERVAALVELLKRCTEEKQQIAELGHVERDRRVAAAREREAAVRLRAIRAPAFLANLGERLAAAGKAHAEAVLACESARAERRAADEALAKHPAKAGLALLEADHERLAGLAERLDAANDALTEASAELAAARAAEDEAGRAHAAAVAACERLRAERRAAETSVGKLPPRTELTLLKADHERLATLTRRADEAAEALAGASASLAEARVAEAEAEAGRAAAQAACDQARAERRAAETAIEELRPRAQLALLADGHLKLVIAANRVAEERKGVRGAIAALESARAAEAVAVQSHSDALAARDALLRANAAYDASQGLGAGDTCPVCGETLAGPPAAAMPEGMEDALAAVDAAHAQLDAARRLTLDCTGEHATCETALSGATRTHLELAAALADQPSASEVAAEIGAVEAAEAELSAARDREHDAEAALEESDEEELAAARRHSLDCSNRHASRETAFGQLCADRESVAATLAGKRGPEEVAAYLERLDAAEAAAEAAHQREREAEAALEELGDAQLAAARKRTVECSNDLAGCQRTVAGVTAEHAKLAATLAGKNGPEEVAAKLEAIGAAEAAAAAARDDEQDAERAVAAALEALEAVQHEEREAWPAYNEAHASVAAFGAPASDHASLARSWTALVTWAGPAATERDGAAATADSEADSAAKRRALTLDGQSAACRALGVDVADGDPLVALAQAEGSQRTFARQLSERVREREKVEMELAEADQRGRVAKTLADALQVNNFERWYLSEALQRLAFGASRRLGELSGGQYTIALNRAGDDFEVVDHQNADERRPVRTLSGGETFLASLSLALALADEVAAMAAATAPRLDALFLDEGFGALDPDTLEVVANALDELRAGGRMVGLVTHVAALAERMPVQFHVRKEAGTSRVTREEA